MGKAVKKSTKVDAAPAGAVAVPNKSANNGKRETEEPIEKLVNAKKQKLDLKAQQAIQKKEKKGERVTLKKINKKVEPSSSDESASESEDEKDAPPKKQPAIDASTESDSSDDEEPKVSAASKKAPVKNGKLTASKKPSTKVKKATIVPQKEESSDGSDESEAESDDEEAAAAEGSSESEDEDEDEKPAQAAKKDNASDEESSEDNDEDDSSEDEDEQPSKTPKKNSKGADVVMVDTKTPQNPQVQSGQSKTLFIGNLSFSVEQSDVEKFFKDAGEIVEVRLASDSDGTFRGFGHVDFATNQAAKKALELNGQPLLGRNVKLDLAKDRTAKTPASGGGGDKGLTIFIRGFDPSGGEEKVRSVLEEHFGPCGEITRIRIPKDYSTDEVKGIAYMDFSDKESVNKALEFNGEELGDHTLTVEEARPRDDSRDGGRGGARGGRRGGGRGGGGFGGGRGGRGFDGGRRGGGRGGSRGFGGGRRGGGRMNRFD